MLQSGEADEKLTNINNKKELEATAKTLAELEGKIHKRIGELEDKKARIAKRMEQANCELTRLKYKLYSIIVHMGSRATCGHYFAYIYNFKTDKWNRLSDEQINEVTEEEVLNVSKGIAPQLFDLTSIEVATMTVLLTVSSIFRKELNLMATMLMNSKNLVLNLEKILNLL